MIKTTCILLFLISAVALAQEEAIFDDKGRRDPFIALVTPDGRLINLEPAGPDTQISLGGIIFDQEGTSYAIINGEVVSVGDSIFGYTVFKIEKNRAILFKDDKPIEFILEKEEE